MKNSWPWKIYTVVFTLIALSNLAFSLSSESASYRYYHILCAFDRALVLLFYLNIASTLTTTVCVLPLVSYISHKKLTPERFWRWLFFLRIFFDLSGHSYEILLCRSTFYMDYRAGLALCGLLILPSIPSYIIHWKAAFTTKNILA